MRITNFEGPGLYDADLWIRNNKDVVNASIVKEVLKTVNIAFVAEGLNRIQSTLLCELKDSYVQQSQRYVSMDKSFYKIPLLNKTDNEKAEELVEKAFDLYGRMSELKDTGVKGRPKAENYKYRIPIEDARYILPLVVRTNMSIAMSGDKLYDLFLLINDRKYFNLFDDFREEITDYLPDTLLQHLPAYYDSSEQYRVAEQFYSRNMKKIDEENNMVYINGFENLDLNVGLGALTSTSAKAPSDILIKWENEAGNKSKDWKAGAEDGAEDWKADAEDGAEGIDEKARGVVERVLGYGHDSIAEQARTTFGMMCSMVTYHQQIRHRLSQNHREDIFNIIKDTERNIIIPPSIKESKFRREFVELANEFKDFRLHVMEEYEEDKSLPFILNCDQIKLIISTNARADSKMLADRICFNAQWEIRDLSMKKLKALRNLSEILYESALPACVKGECREGKLSCGRHHEMKKMFE